MSASWWSEWWLANGEPILNAVTSKSWNEVANALVNAPYTYAKYIKTIYDRSPEHVIIETFLIVFVIYISFVKKNRPLVRQEPPLTNVEIQQLCEDWEPEPIVSKTQIEQAKALNKVNVRGVVENTPNTHIQLRGHAKPLLNLGTFDFLGLAARPEIKDVVTKALKKYGCGSCGPRGFYGTIDVHEILEKDIAKFMGTSDSIIVSDSEATASSVLPTFAKRGDLILVDSGCYDSIIVGTNLARCTVMFYKHNDLNDLERVMKSIRDNDRKAKRGSNCQRRYVVTEALFRNYGDIIDLPAVIALCRKYYFRLFLDESYSFGVLGSTGKGITEHFNVDISEIEVICASLCSSTAGVGGFSTGSQQVVDYQRINSAGYVFSASAPPFTSAATSAAIEIIKSEPNLLRKLHENALYFHRLLSQVPGLNVLSDPNSPLIHIRVENYVVDPTGDLKNEDLREVLGNVCIFASEVCFEKDVAVCASRYKMNQLYEPLPTIRLSINANHTEKQLKDACDILVNAFQSAVDKLTKTGVNILSSDQKLNSEPSNNENKATTQYRSSRRRKGDNRFAE